MTLVTYKNYQNSDKPANGLIMLLSESHHVPYVICKFVPLPSDVNIEEGGTQAPGRPWKYPWPQMEPGDSVVFLDGKERFRSSLSHWKSLHPEQRWVIRRVDDGSLRVWRAT